MKVFSQITLASLASLATAHSIGRVYGRATPLSVELEAAGNSEVKVTVTNNGESTLNLLSKGTFLDEFNPVEKVIIYSAGDSKYQILQVVDTFVWLSKAAIGHSCIIVVTMSIRRHLCSAIRRLLKHRYLLHTFHVSD